MSRADYLFAAWFFAWLAFLVFCYPTERTRYYLELVFPMGYFAAGWLNWLWRFKPEGLAANLGSGSLKRVLALGIVSAFLILDGSRYWFWSAHRSYSLRATAKQVVGLADQLHGKVMGDCARSLMLDQGAMAFDTAGFADDPHWLYEAKGIRLLVFCDDLIPGLRKAYPSIFAAARPVAYWNVHGTGITALRLMPPGDARQ